jgi:triosephosphate isomerase
MRMVVANWKMNHLSKDAAVFCEAFARDYRSKEGVVTAIAPPFTLLLAVRTRLAEQHVPVYAQNAHWEPKGAFTGELSMAQLKDIGCSGVILGHSERRTLFGETDAALAWKLQAARNNELTPLLCVGETLEHRDGGTTLEVLRTQLSILSGMKPGPLVVAYEPVWAIGTGRRAEAPQILEAHRFIRTELNRHLGDAGIQVPILYGGSVTPDNFTEILGIPEVAGALVGGASLDAGKFLKLVQQAQAC